MASKKSLTNFLQVDAIQSSEDFFHTSKQKIQSYLKAQSIHEHRALACIIAIGDQLSQLQEYKRKFNTNKVEKLWNNLIGEFDFSASTISKYIKISQNPVLSDRRYVRKIPPSIYSLYELTKLDPNELINLIECGDIDVNSGRSTIERLTRVKAKKKNQDATVPLMTLRISTSNWIAKFKKIESELLEFLDSQGILYQESREVLRLQLSEKSRLKKIEMYALQRAKKYFQNSVRRYVDDVCSKRNLCSPKTSLKNKFVLLKFQPEEITVGDCVDVSEVQSRLVNLGLITNSEWGKIYLQWIGEAMEKFPSKIPATESGNDSYPDSGQIERIFTPVKKNRDFSSLKV